MNKINLEYRLQRATELLGLLQSHSDQNMSMVLGKQTCRKAAIKVYQTTNLRHENKNIISNLCVANFLKTSLPHPLTLFLYLAPHDPDSINTQRFSFSPRA